jgi:transposase-like protein
MSDHTENSSEKPAPEVPEKAQRRSFDAAYKLRILEEADRCTGRGELGELLRREALYASHLNTWRKQRDEGALNGLRRKKRGRKPKRQRDRELERVRRENDQLRERLRQAELIIDVQKKVSEMLGIPLAKPGDESE